MLRIVQIWIFDCGITFFDSCQRIDRTWIIHQVGQHGRNSQLCHPEPLFQAKDLPEFFKLNCTVLAPPQVLVEEPGQCFSY